MPNEGQAKRTLGVLAGRDMPGSLILAWTKTADLIIAADAGADLVSAVGMTPHIIIGDLDSIQAQPAGIEIRHLEDQSSTDCDKLLSAAVELGCSRITLIGAEGDLLDHMLATLHSAARAPIRVRVALRSGVGWILNAGDEVEVVSKPGRRVSLLPLTESHGASLRGVRWPLTETSISPMGLSSISNAAEGERVYAHLLEGVALLFVEYPASEMPFW